ncbi:MAG: FAD-dependent thymidylate synthase [Candidatus Hecatellales archaeon]|mgnify:CR=1 FL=1|nr:MAG: FAD-dependent thymidylate synthase [Candidatus Hecatellales archaeon]
MVKVKLLRYTRGGIGLIAGSARVSGIPPSLNSRKAVRMMVENDYGSVLEHVYFTFDISEMSIALSRELLEHRIASHTARSTRYHVEEGFGYVTPQPLKRSRRLTKLFRQAVSQARENYSRLYRAMLEEGYSEEEAREAARYLLPMAAHTHYVWTINARSLINFLSLRLCVRASPEMRELATKIYRLVVKIYPEIFEGIGCRGYTLGLCPENENRPPSCPYLHRIPSKVEVKAGRGRLKPPASL